MDNTHRIPPSSLRTVAITGLVMFALVFAAFVTVNCEEAKVPTRFTVTAATFAGLGAIDVAQSSRCLSPTAGCREVGPAYRGGSPARMVGLKAATVAGGIFAAWSLRHTHPKLAYGLLFGFTAMQGIVVTSNYRQLRKAGR